MTTEELIENVKTYLKMPRTGAILINGAWGSGKSYFIKNTLLHIVKQELCYFNLSEKDSGVKEKTRCFIPVMVSLFGLDNSNEILNKIYTEYLAVSPLDFNKIKEKGKSIFKKVNKTIPKIGEWVNFENFWEFKANLSKMSRNVVVILDDIERLDEDIKIPQVLGIINELTENLGIKVILVSNQDYLKKNRPAQLEFHEKVIDNVFSFSPDIKQIILVMAKSLGTNDFSDWIDNNYDLTEQVLDRASDISPAGNKLPFSNLRSIRYAINYFHLIFNDTNLNELQDKKNDFLRYCWYLTLALSIELKRHISFEESISHLSNKDFNTAATVTLDDEDFENSPFLGQQLSDEELKVREKVRTDISYFIEDFKSRYFSHKKKACIPFVAGDLVNFISGRSPLNINALKDAYVSYIEATTFPTNLGENIINNFMHGGLYGSSDAQLKTKLITLFNETKNGNLLQPVSYVNSFIYLNYFAESLEMSQNDIYNGILEGFQIWNGKSRHKITEFQKTHFHTIKGNLSGRAIELFDYIDGTLQQDMEDNLNDEKEHILQCFKTDIRAFHDALVPMQTAGRMSSTITKVMMLPFLQAITRDDIDEKLANLAPTDISLLIEVINSRYKTFKKEDLIEAEMPFIKDFKEALENDRSTEPSHIMARQNLLPVLEEIALKK